MNKKEAQDRIEKLKKEIEKYRYSYHVLDIEDISEGALDALKNELFKLEQKYPQFITPDSPTQRVAGKPLDKFEKFQHPTPMLSFNDAFSKEEMMEWEERYQKFLNYQLEETKEAKYYCELKIDGLAIELIYENGIFTTGSTRGDGKIGENVTQNLKTISSIPLKLLSSPDVIKTLKKEGLTNISQNIEKKGLPKKITVRGEIFVNKSDFERINKQQKKKDEKPFANPRNLAAGSIRQLDPKITASRNLDSFCYSLETDLGQITHEQEHLILKSLGFKTNPHNRPAKELKEVFSFHKDWEEKKEKLPYEIDGIVVINNSEKDFNRAGTVGKAPRAAIAYKFSAEETTTKVLDIIIQIGRTGALTPVAILDPVEIRGAVISRSTLHNQDEIKRLDLKIGDTVIVSRAGDVIPKITKVLPNLRSGNERVFKMPEKCPQCNFEVKTDENGVIYKCTNKDCFARQKESLYHFVSKSGFDIDGLGPKIIDKLIDNNLISEASDIFNLKKGDLEILEGMGEKSAQNLIDSISKKKNISLPRFIYSLGIPQVGEETAIDLTNQIFSKVKKPLDILSTISQIPIKDLEDIRDIGPKTAKLIHEYFNRSKNKKLIKNLNKANITFKESAYSKKLPLANKTFILTGSLESLSREEAKERIRQLGGGISSSVSSKVDFVIAGKDPGSKYEKAKKLGLKILKEKEFLSLLS